MSGIDLFISYSRYSVRQIDPEMVDQALQVFALPLFFSSLSEFRLHDTRSAASLRSLVSSIPSQRNIRRSRQPPPSLQPKMVNTQSFPPAPKAAAGINSSRYARSRAEMINLINQMRAAGVATEIDLPRVAIIVS